ncbi:ANK1, partial [Symbiodinium necroappetens]
QEGVFAAAVCDEEEMLEVRSLSGETWELAPAAFEALVAEHGNSARTLKRHLQGLVGIPRFRQRLLQEARVVEDTEQLALPMSLQLVILPFVQLQDSECNDVAQALAQQDQDKLELLLQRPVDPNTHARDGTSPLHRAMDGRYWETVRLLVEAGVDVDETCRSTGLTPLGNRAANGRQGVGKAFSERHLDMACFLLDCRAQVDKASAEGYRDSVQLLVASRAALDVTRDRDGSTPLLRATERGHVKVVELLIGARANLDIARTDDGKTPLIRALDCENSEIIRLLIEARSDLEKESAKNGTTPLLRACERGRANLVRRLLDARAAADRCHSKTGWTPLQTCVTHRQIDIARMLLEARADLNKESTTDGRTPLLRAVEHGIADMVQFLVEAKADVQQAHDGRAPLSRASARGDLTMVRQLVLGRADLDAVAVAQGTTPLLEAVESGHLRTVQFLIESRADLEKPGHNDTAPLLRACELRKYALVSLLLEQRADVNKKRGVDGETATSRALACGYSEIVRALAEVQAHAKGACWEGQLKMLCFAQRSRW